jgi:beta-porphyranase
VLANLSVKFIQMKKIFIYLTVIIFSNFLEVELFHAKAQNTNLPAPPAGYSWTAIDGISDEFNQANLDTNKWMPMHPWWSGPLPSKFSPENVYISGGMLCLRSTTTITNLSQVTDQTNDAWISAACVCSQQAMALYGYYEARLKASHLSMLSSFWLQSPFSSINVSEIDVEEVINNSAYMPMTYHYFTNGFKSDISQRVLYKMPSSASADFHIYGVWWKDKNTLWFYYDGSKVGELAMPMDFLKPMNVFLNTQASVNNGLPTVDSLRQAGTNTMFVDWVHSWKLVTKNLDPPKNLRTFQ